MRQAIAALLLASSLGCATLFNGSKAHLDVISFPGEEVTLDGVVVGRSPIEVAMSNHSTHVITVGDPRHPTATCTLEPHLGIGWVILDLMYVFPLIIDGVTGNWRSIDSSECGSYR